MVQTELSKRKRKMKAMVGETSNDERDMPDALSDYRVYPHNVVMDRVVQSLESRFTGHEQLYKDLAYFDLCNFKDIAVTGLLDNALLEISNYMKDIDLMDLKLELISFVKNYEVLQLTLPVSVDSGCEALSKKCAVCALAIIGANKLNAKVYDKWYQAYKFIST